MRPQYVGIAGMFLLTMSRLLLSNGTDFIQSQRPFDIAHTLMMTGAVMTLAFIRVFPKNIFNTIGAPLMILGAIAHIAMCSIDMVFWSYGSDQAGRDALLRHLMGTPAIWLPLFTVGPALLYAGLATQVWHFVLRRPVISIVTILASLMIGLGQFIWRSEYLVLGGYLVFTLGLAVLTTRSLPDKKIVTA